MPGDRGAPVPQGHGSPPRGPFGLLRPLVARQLGSLLPANLARLKQLAEDSR